MFEAREGGRPISAEENKASLRRLYEEVFNTGDLTSVDELVAPDAIEHEELLGSSAPGQATA